jgi:hypothetical protein
MNLLLLTLIPLIEQGFDANAYSKSQILKTLDRMEAAVNTQDMGLYMAQISPRNENFLKEQRAWFDDLKRNPVSDFRIEPIGGFTGGLNGVSAVLELQFHWTLESDGIERSITYISSFVGPRAQHAGPWFYNGRKWPKSSYWDLRSTDCCIVHAGKSQDSVYQSVIKLAPLIRSKIEADLDQQIEGRIEIKIYPDMQALQFSIAPGYINPISGWNEPGESIKIIGRESISEERLSSLLAHEIGHAVSFEFGEQIIDAPWWSLEGIAELVADEYRSTSAQEREVAIAKQVSRGDRRTWDQLADFKGEALIHSNYVYSQGWSMVRYITNRFGSKARNNWFVAMGRGLSVEDATKEVLKIEFADLDLAWESEMLSIAQQAEEEDEAED